MLLVALAAVTLVLVGADGWVVVAVGAAAVQRASDGGILVNRHLESSVPGVFAAGDCCTVQAQQQACHWFQMRLWTQVCASRGSALRQPDKTLPPCCARQVACSQTRCTCMATAVCFASQKCQDWEWSTFENYENSLVAAQQHMKTQHCEVFLL